MNIYVGNLSLEITEDELRQEFIAFGEVASVRLMNDKYIGSGRTSGYGYVNMILKSAGFTAIASLNGKKIRNRAINVVEALPLSAREGSVDPTTSRYHLHRSRRRSGSSAT